MRLFSVMSLAVLFSMSAHALNIREIEGPIWVPQPDLHLQTWDLNYACVPRNLWVAATATEPGIFSSCKTLGRLGYSPFSDAMPPYHTQGFLQFDFGAFFSSPSLIAAFHDIDHFMTVVTRSGRHAGYTVDEYGTPNAYIWDSASGSISMREGSVETWIFGSNDSGTLFVGAYYNYAALWRFPVSSPRFEPEYVIPPPPPGSPIPLFDTSGTAYDVNEAGNVVGIANWRGSSIRRAFLRKGSGQLVDLQAEADGELHPLPSDRFYESVATSINNSNYVVGSTYQVRYIGDRRMYAEVKPRAFWWKPKSRFGNSEDFDSGEFHSLPQAHSKALAINHSCRGLGGPVFVGYFLPERSEERDDLFYPGELETRFSEDTGAPYHVFHERNRGPGHPFRKHAFAYDVRNRQFVDLNEMASLLLSGSDWKLEVATSIDDQGRIIGYGKRQGRPAGFMMDGICEFLRGQVLEREWSERLRVTAPTVAPGVSPWMEPVAPR